MDLNKRLTEILAANSIQCSDFQAGQLVKFYEMLVEKNKVMNLTAITDFEEVAVKHFSDSLSIYKIADLNNQKIIDIGTGAGFPGIPLKILYPDIDLVLLDSLNKRLVFLNEVIEELGLEKVITLHSRAEEVGVNNNHRERYDIVVSRAVAILSTLVEYCLPLVSVGGCFISYKGSKASEEVNEAGKAIQVLGGGKVEQVDFIIPNTDFERSLIKINKIKSTPAKYPRAGGKPSSAPIK